MMITWIINNVSLVPALSLTHTHRIIQFIGRQCSSMQVEVSDAEWQTRSDSLYCHLLCFYYCMQNKWKLFQKCKLVNVRWMMGGWEKREEESAGRMERSEGGGQKTSKVSSSVLVIYLVFIFFTVSSSEYHRKTAENVEYDFTHTHTHHNHNNRLFHFLCVSLPTAASVCVCVDMMLLHFPVSR